MRVLVTGASGMLGGGVARALAARGDDVTVLQRRPSGLAETAGVREVLGDVVDAEAVARAMAGQDAVVHLAAKVNVMGRWEDYVRVNVVGTRTMLDAARRHAVPRFVHTSSPSVAHAGASLVGEGAGPTDPEQARGNYARSKALSERIALAADARNVRDGIGPAVTVIRPHLVWGPGDTQLVARVIRRAQAGRLPVIGSGAALVDTTYVDNAVDAFVAALDRCEAVRGESFVVTNGEPRPVSEIFAAWARAGGADPSPTRIPTRLAYAAGGVVDAVTAVRERIGTVDEADPPLTRFLVEQLTTAHWFDQRRTREALGWTPRVTLDEGFERLAAAR
ncbi:NAD-dependent epimerase/dehydratase family protein [Mobilicoccus pelagius]|uniref:Putative sterol dehydrogenase n=1 Tax=Mobilicoccus pelagius NBRC 104925 TaxID=1089455 RepID=H5UT28_9MICO|nr:NAD-dependent epimerase/dehydratase family protein [Mobilicoccus pelagius]GAB48886.1 putative sterol dehydrogenase [Mobilicoccus pelagius NBRC 104925]